MIANLAGQMVIVVTGGAVRLTGSGLGCSTWPQCEPGSFTPAFHEEIGIHPYIEFGNRTLTGVLIVLAVGTAVSIWWGPATANRSRAFRWLGLAPLIGVVVQGVVGGITVLVDLHPAVVGWHMGLSLILIAVSALLAVRLREGDGPPLPLLASPADGRARVLAWALGITAGLVVTLGIITTGSGPHSGDSEVGYRFALDPFAVARLHALSTWVFVAVFVAVALLLRRSTPSTHASASDLAIARRRAIALGALTLAQGGVGYWQLFTGLPELLVGIHMAGAALMVTATTFTVLGLRVRPAGIEPITTESATAAANAR